LVPLLQQSSQVYWLSALFELKLSTIAAIEAIDQQGVVLRTLKASKMNRLQRSIVSEHVSAVADDSTVRVSKFLSNTLAVLSRYLRDHVEVDDWKVSRFWFHIY
jgi:hypothetical protein